MKKYSPAVFAVLSPFLASAQTYNVTNLTGAVSAIADILNTIFPALVAIGVFMVAWGIFKFILNAGDSEGRKNGLATVFWSVIGVFLMFSVWGLVNILNNTFTLNNTPLNIPALLPNGGK